MGDLSWHMAEHLVLTTVLAPVLPLAVLGMTRRLRPELAMPRIGLAAGVVVSTGALVLWHVPALFDAAVDNGVVHAAQHLSFVGTAVVLWDAVWRSDSAGKILALFVAGLPPMALGAAMTLSTTPWYHAALDDQRVAGALMWGAGSVTGLVAAGAAFAVWLKESQSRGTTSARGSSAPRRSADDAA